MGGEGLWLRPLPMIWFNERIAAPGQRLRLHSSTWYAAGSLAAYERRFGVLFDRSA
jgi:hypothetical protein